MDVKYPKTLHFPDSPGVNDDDKVWHEAPQTLWGSHVVVTEKLDGECTTLTPDKWHARSLDTPYHPSRRVVQELHDQIKREIPTGWRICGENCYAFHSIFYEMQWPWFYVFSIWDDKNRCLPWDETVEYASVLNLPTVPEIYCGDWSDERQVKCWTNTSHFPQGEFGPNQEGYVVRVAGGFHFDEFSTKIAKWVRSNHVKTADFWLRYQIVVNQHGNANAALERLERYGKDR